MQIIIRSNDFALTDSLRHFLNSQIRKSMASCARSVELMTVRLKDINGPKGGVDKECIVEVKVANRPPVVVRKRNSDAYQGIRQALARAARVTLRKLRKTRARKNSNNPIPTKGLSVGYSN